MIDVPSGFDSSLDLVVERTVRASRDVAWNAWTEPERLRQWYAPAPSVVVECVIDLRPGGVFEFVTRRPDGGENTTTCCYLVVEPLHRLVWTDALRPGYRPSMSSFFTGVMTLEESEGLTTCRAMAMHRDRDAASRHDAAGFHEGWGSALDQLVAHVTP